MGITGGRVGRDQVLGWWTSLNLGGGLVRYGGSYFWMEIDEGPGWMEIHRAPESGGGLVRSGGS